MIKKSSILDVRVDASDIESVTYEIVKAIRHRDLSSYICVANVHMVVTAWQSGDLKSIMEGAFAVVSDGMPLVWLLHRSGLSLARRVDGPSLMKALCSLSEKEDLKIYLYGGTQDVLNRLVQRLESDYTGIQLVGFQAPPLISESPALDENVINEINQTKADIVFVGLGCPKQERWMHVHAPNLDSISIGVGAAFDFLSGDKKRAPAFMQKTGLEWLFRLASEPGRLWKRYLYTNTRFVFLVAVDLASGFWNKK